MRYFIIIVLSFFQLCSIAQSIDKKTEGALSYINQGYIQYGFEELKKVAATNGIAAQYYVAVCYENGIGTEKDLTQAFKMYRKAAERGLPDAMYHIASFYHNGIVVSKDASREEEWLQRYNQKGGILILPDLMLIYNEGLNYPNNYALNPNSTNQNGSNLIAQSNVNNNSLNQVINNITVVQPTLAQVDNPQPQLIVEERKSDVDQNIPYGIQNSKDGFALIIANEDYQDEEKVPNALNDGKIFAEYCIKTLGIPESNVKLVENATLNNIKRQIHWLNQVMEAYQGEASVIFYYAGHGIPDEKNGAAYLLPVDGFGSDITTGYSLEKLYSELSSKPAKSVVVLLDACFSGSKREGGMLASARGVAIKAKQNAPKGNMIVISAAQGDETAYPYLEKRHGMFTYFLLKKLQETKGDVTYGELADYITSEVKKQSIIINGKMQTPTATASESATNWKSWKLR